MRLGRTLALAFVVPALVAATFYFVFGSPRLRDALIADGRTRLATECALVLALPIDVPVPVSAISDRWLYVLAAPSATPTDTEPQVPWREPPSAPELNALTVAQSTSTASRISPGLGERVEYAACRNAVGRVVRIGATQHELTAIALRVDLIVLGHACLFVIVGLLAARREARRLGTRLQQAQRSADRALDDARGDDDTAGEDELGDLELAIQSLRRRVDETRSAQRAEIGRVSTMLDQMAEGVALIERGRIVLANQPYAEILGARGEVAGRTVLESVRLPALAELLTESLAARERRKRVITHGDRALSVEVHPFGVGDEPNCVLVVADVSEAERLERVRRDFVANASHELRTPVAAILGATETLLGGAADSPQPRRSFLAILERHARRLERLTKELLDLSRLEHGYRPQIESLSLRPVLQQVTAMLEPEAVERGVELRLDVKGDLPLVAGDRQGVEQIVYNLTDNAIRYTPRGGSVTLRATATKRSIEIIVADTGPGIDKEHASRVFERFYRVDDSRSRGTGAGGTGIGLSIVKHLVAAHGGEIRLDSEVGVGSKFIVTLPAA